MAKDSFHLTNKIRPTHRRPLPDLPKASGIIVNDLMYKHWDEWVESIPHPFIADFDGNMMGAATDIMEGEPFEAQ